MSIRNKDARVNGPLLKKKVEDLAFHLAKSMFVATDGSFSRWLKRENIHYLKLHGEQGDADISDVDKWLRMYGIHRFQSTRHAMFIT